MQIDGDAPVAIAAMVRQHDFLNGNPHGHLCLVRFLFHQLPVIAGPTHFGQIAHPFYRQRALLLRPRLDDAVDAKPPVSSLLWRRSSILSKASLKKSFSNVFSASADFSFVISSRSCLSLRSSAVVAKFACRGSERPSNWYFQV